MLYTQKNNTLGGDGNREERNADEGVSPHPCQMTRLVVESIVFKGQETLPKAGTDLNMSLGTGASLQRTHGCMVFVYIALVEKQKTLFLDTRTLPEG